MRPVESFVGQPIRSLQTMLWVISTQAGDLTPVIPDGIYGAQTMAAVSRFQKEHGLGVTGVTDQATWEAIVAAYEPARINVDAAQSLQIVLNPNQILRKGQRHPVLYLVQAMLLVLSQTYASVGTPTQSGVLDASTADALASFQRLSGLPMTGELDKRTWKHLALQYPLAANLERRL